MSSKTRSFRDLRNPIGVLILLAAFAAAAGCSTANKSGGDVIVDHVNASGNSVPGWVTPTGGIHARSATLNYIANGGNSDCTQCHGSDLSGGISTISCFSNTAAGCHHVTGVGAPVWSNPLAHGATAKKAPGSSGFASCQICHGRDFSGGGAQVSCFRCHEVSAPHAPAPWRGSPYTHVTTDPKNAPVCAQCHFPESPNNPANHPATPAPAGTAPGCFNSTLCHGENPVPHPVGNAWVTTSPAAQPHGNSAKATPGATAGFAYCQVCHGTGTNFAGGSSGVSCTNTAGCHGATAASPHASQWRTGDSYVHTTTDAGNAPVCAFCHLNGANSPISPPSPPAPAGTTPGCFNGTLCHGTGGAPHPIPYNDNSHYTVTSATFPGSCSACHDVSAPSTKIGPVCQTCHAGASPLAAVNCTSCHASPPNGGAPAGAVYANIAGAHAVHLALNSTGSPVSCDTCHTGLGSRTNAHYNNAKSRVPPGDVAFPATYNAKSGASSFLSGALTCTNVSCHGGTSPNWQVSAIDVNTQCAICHLPGTTQYNSYNSGEHGINSAHSICTNCHNTTTLALNHFTTLADNAISPAVASATIGGAGTSITTWTPGSGTSGTCFATCHGQNMTW